MPEAPPEVAGFSALVEILADRPRVTLGSARRGFGSDALQVDGRIFAMARRGGLVLKLPAARVAGLIASGSGTPFDAGKGRPMKEWVVLRPASPHEWLSLAEEALAFVGGG